MKIDSRGFIALISVLILSVVLLAAVITLAQYGIISRYALLDIENKNTSESLAHACLQVARIAVVNDPLYEVTDRDIPLDGATCAIENIYANTPTSGRSRIQTSAVTHGATTNLKAEVHTSTGVVVRLEEVPSL